MKGFRLGRAAGILLLAAGLALWLWFRPDRALRVATGVVAHDLCSKTFTSGLAPEMVMAETVTRSGIRRFKWVLRYRVHRDARSVVASLGGLLTSRAVHREGLGCVMQHQTLATHLHLKGATRGGQPLLVEIAGPQVVEPEEPALKAALDNAFAEPSVPPLRRTKAMVVVKDGRIIAERYAQGIGWGEMKEELFEYLDAHLRDARAEYERLMAAPEHVEAVLRAGARRAREIATPFLARIRQAVGVRALA